MVSLGGCDLGTTQLQEMGEETSILSYQVAQAGLKSIAILPLSLLIAGITGGAIHQAPLYFLLNLHLNPAEP